MSVDRPTSPMRSVMSEFWITLIKACSITVNLKDGQFGAQGFLGVVAALVMVALLAEGLGAVLH